VADSTPTTAAGWTHNAIQEINSGEVSDARQMLAAALRIDPDYELAWIWFGSIATDDAERRYCFERAVAIDPASVVADQLARIKTTESHPPVELQDLEAPPLPEEFGGVHYEEPPRKRVWWPLALIAGVLLVALIGGIWFLWPRPANTGEPIYVAFVAGMTGNGAVSAQEMLRGLDVYSDYGNGMGGIEGRPLKIVTFDDEDNPDKAVEVANEIVADGRFVAVIGHRLSSTSIAAAPIYEAAGIPMISPTATADELTANCDTCYRAIFDNSTQGKMIASYIYGVLGVDQVVLISEESSYGNTLANGFLSVYEQAGGKVLSQYSLPADPSQAGDTIQQTAQEIASQHPDELVVMTVGSELAQPVLLALRGAGIDGTIFGSDTISSRVFLESADQASKDAGGGDVTTGLYASAPVFVDSLTGDAVRLAAKFEEVYGELPTWRSFTSADAGVAVVNGLRAIGDDRKDHTVDDYRTAILTRWKEIDAPNTSIQAFIGPLYFDANRSASRPVAIGIANETLYDSAPRQLIPSTSTNGNNAPQTIEVGDNTFAVKRVVQTGVDFNLLRDLNTVSETFYADFFVWFKYYGDDDAADVVFTNISDPQTLTVDEMRSEDVNGQKYKVYRVTGTFTSPLDFRAFPFDSQDLQVHYQNRTLTSSQLVYAIDSDFAQIDQSERLSSGGNATTAINQISNWQANSLQAFAGSVGTSSNLGDPDVQVATQGIEFSQVGVNIDISRNVAQFLLKNLLPLVLLLAITYISLFFSHDQTTERVSFGITGVLTGAVLLSTVVSVLPDVGYTVAIEWAFYAFILLSALCILVALIGGRLNEAKQISEMRTLDVASRIGYPILVALVVLGYWYFYS
jgi:ABC-type branched-subunit amino acid transport system substrate-binding protein